MVGIIRIQPSESPALIMHDSGASTRVLLLCLFILFFLVLFLRPNYLANPEVLGSIVVIQVVLASICKYKQWFFLVLMLAFLWAGVRLPLSEAWLQGRWIVLATGALAGIGIYMRGREHRFGAIHLLALLCVLSAVVSASVSAYPQEALLKSLSLFLLFLYGAMGARLALQPLRPEIFFRRLLLACEIVTYIVVFSYFVLRFQLFGNPNSLGAVMGVVVVPVLIWGFLCAQSVIERRRLGLALSLATALLMSSFSRAAIAAAGVSCLLILIALRRYRFIIGGLAASAVIALATAALVPRPAELAEGAQTESITSLFLYKGKPAQGLLGSRKGPWDRTLAVISAHPWFGSGFGTSVTDRSASYFELTRSRFIDSRMAREHGNSYLAILEWSGLLGVFPFYLLIAVVASHAAKSMMNLRRTGNILSPAVPAAAIILAGLMGAAFEDWLFAVGYYLAVFVWTIAFLLADLVQTPFHARSTESTTMFQDARFPAANPPFISPVVVQ